MLITIFASIFQISLSISACFCKILFLSMTKFICHRGFILLPLTAAILNSSGVCAFISLKSHSFVYCIYRLALPLRRPSLCSLFPTLLTKMESLIKDYVVEAGVEDGDIPPIFRPYLHLRSGGRPAPRTRDLEVFEKNWLCREALGKNLDLKGNFRPKCKHIYLMKQYDVGEKYFQRNLRVFHKKGTTNPSHRPSSIDNSDALYTLNGIAKMREAGNEASKYEIYDMLREAKRQRTEDLNSDRFDPRAMSSAYTGYSTKAMDNFISKFCIEKSVNDTAYTSAREKATGDPFLSYAWYLVNEAYSGHLTDLSKWNADGTTFVFSAEGHVKHVYRLSKELELQINGGVPSQTKYSEKGRRFGPQDFDYAIKVMHLCNAHGDVGTLTAVVAVDSMDAEDFHVERIAGFSNTCAAGQSGYIYFTKTRAGNKNMWSHYFLTVVIPCITSVGVANGIHDFGYFFSTDSEDVIISQAFNQEVHRALVNNKINYARIGASLTSIHQACDLQETFRKCKHFVKKSQAQNVKNNGDTNIKRHIAVAFFNLREKLSSSGASITALFEEKCTRGLLLIRDAFQESITKKIIREGFVGSGQHIDDEKSPSTVSFIKIMSQCKAVIPLDQLKKMVDATSVLVANVRQRGTVSYNELIEQGIQPRQEYTLNRTEMSRIHHWAEIVTHPSIVAKYHAEVEARLPEVVEISKATKLIEARNTKVCQHQIAEEKARLAKAQKLLEKQKQKEYMASLTPAQRKVVKAQLREEADKEKQQKADQAAQKIREAENIVAASQQQSRFTLDLFPSFMGISSLPAFLPAPQPGLAPEPAPEPVPESIRTKNKRKRN